MDKGEGDNVSAGTLNRSGFIKAKASRVGKDTTLSQIIQMVSDAAATKAPIARIADQISGIFCAGGYRYCDPDLCYHSFKRRNIFPMPFPEP